MSKKPSEMMWGEATENEYNDEGWWSSHEPESSIDVEVEEEDLLIRSMSQLDMLINWKAMKAEVKMLRSRIYRRSCILEQMRRSYINDVVGMKMVLKHLDDVEKPEFDQLVANWQVSLPSIDLNEPLSLHGPNLCFMSVTPCTQCGGTVDLVRYDGEQVKDLTKKLDSVTEKFKVMRLNLAQEQSKQEDTKFEAQMERKRHDKEVILM